MHYLTPPLRITARELAWIEVSGCHTVNRMAQPATPRLGSEPAKRAVPNVGTPPLRAPVEHPVAVPVG